jgi:3-deoxy-D-arabino-heptulosonate 7-phosphate (DAHP) synthase
VEAHPDPAQAWSDAAQAIGMEALAALVADAERMRVD